MNRGVIELSEVEAVVLEILHLQLDQGDYPNEAVDKILGKNVDPVFRSPTPFLDSLSEEFIEWLRGA